MNHRMLVGTRKGVFTLERGAGGSWSITRTAFLADSASMLLPDHRDGTIYAALNLGHFGVKLHRSRDNGETWQECAAPVYPEPPEGHKEEPHPFGGAAVPWDLKLIWALETGGTDEPGLIWCGTVPGGLFRSPDGGDSWEFVRSLWDMPERKEWFGGGMDFAGIHSICVDPRDSKRVTVGVSCGGVWITPDGGDTWECRATGMWASYMPPDRRDDPLIQDPHRLVQCPAAPDSLWVQHHNGVFSSTDGSESWQEVKAAIPSTFGFAVVVHPDDPKTAWFVPAISDEKRIPVDGKVVVSRTRDGGESFEVLTSGLPQSHAYDLTFRHALGVDASGQTLAFGTTTGSLWVSENQGDSWTCLSNHLPPIYCVRFG